MSPHLNPLSIERMATKQLPAHWQRLQLHLWGKDQLVLFLEPLLQTDRAGHSLKLSLFTRQALVDLAEKAKQLLVESALHQEEVWHRSHQSLLKQKHAWIVEILNQNGVESALDERGEWHIISHSFRYFDFVKSIPSTNRFQLIEARHLIQDLFSNERMRLSDLSQFYEWEDRVQSGYLQERMMHYQQEWNIVFQIMTSIESMMELDIE